MKKKGKAKGGNKDGKVKKGKKYVCDVCGMTVAVDKECGCDPCDIVCCGEDMKLLAC